MDKSDSSGLPIVQKNFSLNSLHQAALWVKAVTEQLTINTEDIQQLKNENESLKKRLSIVETQLELSRNEHHRQHEYDMYDQE